LWRQQKHHCHGRKLNPYILFDEEDEEVFKEIQNAAP
jgi:hypothetical protein